MEIDGRVEQIKSKYPDVFSGRLGCLKDFKVHIPVPDNVKPVYFKPRSAPYAMKC